MKFCRWFLLALMGMLPAALSTPGQQPSTSARGWQQSLKPDPGRDTSSTQFLLTGKFLTLPTKDSGGPPALAVSCGVRRSKPRFTTGYVNVGAPLNIEYIEPEEIKAGISYYPKVIARYRLDDGKEEKDQWTPGTEKTSAGFTKSALEKMLRAHTVEITVREFHGGEISMQFDIPDSTQLENACGIRIRKK